jgi:KAP family P-loop domain/TIR domain
MPARAARGRSDCRCFGPDWTVGRQGREPRREPRELWRRTLGCVVEVAFKLLDDQPYADEAEDPLGYDKIASSVANLVLASRDSTPLTLGIEGGWGSGKSTLMNRLERELREGGVTTVMFNAWTAPKGGAVEGLVKSVLGRLNKSILWRAAHNTQVLSWARALTSAGAEVVGVGRVVDTLWTQLASDPKARNEISDLVSESMRLWKRQRSRRGQDELLAVFVDDLDRCSPVNVLQVFEAIKLYLDAPGLVFVVGYDRDVVTDAILDVKQYQHEDTSHHYVEKIVQLVYRLPSVSDGDAERLLELYLQAARTVQLFDPPTRTLTIDQNVRNPRRIKRFINAFILEFGLDAEWSEFGAETLVRVLIIDLYFPDFGRLLRGRGPDPVQGFRDYVAVREILRKRSESSSDMKRVSELFDSWRLPPPSDDKESAIRDLDAARPAFPKFAENSEFPALIYGLKDIERLREKLRRFTPASVSRPAEPASDRIFISYRREDTGNQVVLLADRLAQTFGRDRVSVDVDLAVGEDFAQALRSAVEGATVLAVIGPRWLSPRLDDADDFVRRELSSALQSSTSTVIPVLIDHAQLPEGQALPLELKPLTLRQAITLSEPTWGEDVDRLIQAIEYRVTGSRTQTSRVP